MLLNMGECLAAPNRKRENAAERLLEDPFLKMELARAEMCRANQPSEVNEGIINVLSVWAIIFCGVSIYWFVKYVI